MTLKSVLCTCGKSFGTNGAKLQHQRDSQLHSDTPQAPAQMLDLEQLVQRLSLQEEEPDHHFIPFLGGEPTRFLAQRSHIHIEQVMAGVKNWFVAEGTKPKKEKRKKKKTRKGTSVQTETWQASHSIFKVNPNTGRTMNMLEGQDWAVCDKDCGWCGHCAEGLSY
ncbi:hypothetical protein IFR05_011511 [Cadophora sp. M221]|nr:hypothetical protein IFR05_011511 [Cadophora sp. M221]